MRRAAAAVRIALKSIVLGSDGINFVAFVSIATPGGAKYTEAMKKRTMNEVHDAECAVAATAEVIASKWTPLIVHDLSEGPRRFMQLEHACPGISPRTLSERLHMLEQEGIVIRRSYPESPPRVEYELTDKGRALLPIINAMRRFGRSWLIRVPTRRHDARSLSK
jgi:DNA-binding HxlR family transcriptional regulator